MSLAVMSLAECKVSVARIQRFLDAPELPRGRDPPLPAAAGGATALALAVARATCHWHGDGRGAVALEDVTLDFPAASLTCVVGSVGSGKSALLQMLAGELPLSGGTLRRREGAAVAYAPQVSGSAAPFVRSSWSVDPAVVGDAS